MTHEAPSLARMLLRAASRRCPRCGDRRAWFTNFFRQGERCVGCGLRRTRGVDGHELGSMTVAITLNIGLIMVAMAIAVALTVPDVPVVTLYLVLMTSAVVIPVGTWPMTHTLWSAIDLRVRPVTAEEADDARSWVEAHRTNSR
ncbi:MAG: hypothetical protein F2562_07790 [Actinobacteria bacterium]|nr:hypothetical protein [Actinomycetota bacterium]